MINLILTFLLFITTGALVLTWFVLLTSLILRVIIKYGDKAVAVILIIIAIGFSYFLGSSIIGYITN